MNTSVPSITLVDGYHFLKQGGIHLSTFDWDIHIGNSLNLTYIKLIHVVKILLTVEGLCKNGQQGLPHLIQVTGEPL